MCCAPKIPAMHDTSLRHQIDATLFASQELQFHFLPLWTEVALPKQMNSEMFLWQKALFLCKLHIFRTARRISCSIARWRHMLRTTVGHIFASLHIFLRQRPFLYGTDICTEKWPRWPCISTKTIGHLLFKAQQQEVEDCVRRKVWTIKRNRSDLACRHNDSGWLHSRSHAPC